MSPLSFVGWAIAIYLAAHMAISLMREISKERNSESIEDYLRTLYDSELYYAEEIIRDEKKKRVRDIENTL